MWCAWSAGYVWWAICGKCTLSRERIRFVDDNRHNTTTETVLCGVSSVCYISPACVFSNVHHRKSSRARDVIGAKRLLPTGSDHKHKCKQTHYRSIMYVNHTPLPTPPPPPLLWRRRTAAKGARI